MANIIDSLFLELGFDTTKIIKGQKEASSAVKKTSEEFEKHGKVIEKQAKQFGEAVGTSTVKLLGLFATMLMGGKAAREFSQYITDADASLGRSARNIQVSTDALQEWQGLVKQAGGSAEDATAGIQALSSSIANVKLGHISEQFAEGWFKIAALGGKAMDWSKPLDQSMLDLSENLHNVAAKDGPAVALQLAKMIGINESLFNVLVRGREVNAQLLEQQKQRGIADAADIKRQQELQVAQANTRQAGMNLGRTVSAIFHNLMMQSNEWLQNATTNFNNWIIESYPKFDNFVKRVTAGFERLKDIFFEDFTYIGNHWREMLGQMWGWFGDFGKKIGESETFILSMFQQGFGSALLWLKREINSIWSAAFGHQLFGDVGGTGALSSLGEGAGTDLGGGRFHTPGMKSADPGHGARGLADRGGSSPGTKGWWTADRVSHAIEKLKAGGVSELGAQALVSRWMNVESSGGPASVNPKSGAFGIGQWLGSRKAGIAGNTDFDAQLDHAIKELHGSEGAALRRLNAAKTADEAATGASAYERAEGYNPATGRDNFTGRTAAGIRGIIGGKKDQGSAHSQTDPHKPGFDPNSVQYHDYFPKPGASLSPSSSTTNNTSHEAHITINSSSGNPHEIAKAVKDSIDRTSYAMHGNYSLA
jgi:hypothetical protein